MTDRITARTPLICSDERHAAKVADLEQQLAALRAVARGYCPTCGRGDAAPSVADWEQQKQRADQLAVALDEVLRHFVHKGHPGEPCLQTGWISERTVARWRETLYQPTPAPAATEATEHEKTTRVFAALHRSAEQDVSRVIALYERWVKAGPPPLGTSMSRWWDRRLAELHRAIQPPDHNADHPRAPAATEAAGP